MFSVLLWKPLKVAPGLPLRVTATGNVDTRVVTRYFWIPVAGQPAAASWDRNDGVELNFDTSLVVAGKDNRLGFVCQVGAKKGTDTSLLVMVQFRQGSTILLEQDYTFDVPGPDSSVQMSDGVSLTF